MNNKNLNRRRFERINVYKRVTVEFPGKTYDTCQVRNISLGGMFLRGKLSQNLGEQVQINSAPQLNSPEKNNRASGIIVWANKEGGGVKFTTDNSTNFLFLSSLISSNDTRFYPEKNIAVECPKYESNQYPKIEWCNKFAGNNLRFTFGKNLTKAEAVHAIEKWKEAFLQRKGEEINLIWDCTYMQDYEVGGRTKWIKALFQTRPQIGKIWLITDSPFIKLGGTIMSVAASFKINILPSEKDFEASE